MKKYKIPREVQIEDRIFGPITMRRLIILTIGGGITYMIFMKLSSQGVIVWGIPTFFAVAVTLSLAFLEPFGMRFIKFILRMIEFLVLPKQRVWDKRFSTEVMFKFYSSEHKKWIKKNAKKIPSKTLREQKAEKRAHLEQFSPLLDLDLSEISVPTKTHT